MILQILLFTFIGSVFSLIGGLILLSKEKLTKKISHFLASFAAGVLLGTAFFDLLPEALHEGEELGINPLSWVMVGILAFFFLERFIHWFHHHEEDKAVEKEVKSTVPLIILSDTIHNFLDGIVIAATFIADPRLGLITAIAVAAHEIPQEIGDFGLLLHKGLKRSKVILINILSAGVSFLGAAVTIMIGETLERFIPILLALTAGFFIYIAASDLIPEIHYERRRKHAILESALLLIGVVIIWLAVTYLHEGH